MPNQPHFCWQDLGGLQGVAAPSPPISLLPSTAPSPEHVPGDRQCSTSATSMSWPGLSNVQGVVALVSELYRHRHITQPAQHTAHGESPRHQPPPSFPHALDKLITDSYFREQRGCRVAIALLVDFFLFFKWKCNIIKKMFSFMLSRFVSKTTPFAESQNAQSSSFYNNNKSREMSALCVCGVGFCWNKTHGNFENIAKHVHVFSKWCSFWLTPVGFSIKGRIQPPCRRLQQMRELFSQKVNLM